MFKIKKGLDLPIAGVPAQHVSTGASVRHVAILGDDYLGMRPSMLVQEGDRVIKGQALFEDKKSRRDVHSTRQRHRCGDQPWRTPRLQSVVIRIEGDEQREFARYDAAELASLSGRAGSAAGVRFVDALRTRPFSKSPVPGTEPAAIFVTAIDTNPLSADPQPVILRSVKPLMPGLPC
jgi:Na+-transporting NADH:ubiquinone oxidoreductase subunit A